MLWQKFNLLKFYDIFVKRQIDRQNVNIWTRCEPKQIANTIFAQQCEGRWNMVDNFSSERCDWIIWRAVEN